MSDRESELKHLFLQSLQGDAPSYEEVLRRISVLLRGYLMKTMNPRLRTQEQVEDLVQDVLISIHNKRDLYDVRQPLLPWVYAIARYRLIDSLRAEKRRPECVEWVEAFDVFASVENPPLALEEEQAGDALVEGLSSRQKEILRLAKVEGVSLSEIALKMDMSLSAVKVSVHRSLKLVRKRFGKNIGRNA